MLGLNYNDFVKINKKYFRPEELDFLKGEASDVKKIKLEVEYTFESMIGLNGNSLDELL